MAASGSTRDIKLQYRNLSLKWHPDMAGKLGPVFANRERFVAYMSEVFMLLKEAYQVLTDESERKRYDSLVYRKRG